MLLLICLITIDQQYILFKYSGIKLSYDNNSKISLCSWSIKDIGHFFGLFQLKLVKQQQFQVADRKPKCDNGRLMHHEHSEVQKYHLYWI